MSLSLNCPVQQHLLGVEQYQRRGCTKNISLVKVATLVELVYTTIDWPFKIPSLEISLNQFGKSRADLWQLAGMVALEQTVERANRACDLDFHAT